jgi:hypothetical protein
LAKASYGFDQAVQAHHKIKNFKKLKKKITDSNQLLLSNSVYNPFCATNSQLERQVLNKHWVLAPHHHRLLAFVRGS